jgi:hypothetical protein
MRDPLNLSLSLFNASGKNPKHNLIINTLETEPESSTLIPKTVTELNPESVPPSQLLKIRLNLAHYYVLGSDPM